MVLKLKGLRIQDSNVLIIINRKGKDRYACKSLSPAKSYTCGDLFFFSDVKVLFPIFDWARTLLTLFDQGLK